MRLVFVHTLALLALLPLAEAQLVGTSVTDHATTGQPLVQPRQVRLSDASPTFDLELGTVPFETAHGTFNTRAFNGEVPAPTLIFKRGVTNKMNFVNKLAGPDSEHQHNRFGSPSSSNVHTHGLHLPHVAPGDDVKTVVPPETEYLYEWPVPADHLPGTHWYHPHLHGSTALQVSEPPPASGGNRVWLC